MEANNFHGYIAMYRELPDANDPELSEVIGKPRGAWHTLSPMVIYPTVPEVMEAIPDFDKKRHIIGEVIVHLLSERVEILTS